MKRYLVIVLLIPFLSFSQSVKEYFEKGSDYAKTGEYQLAINNFTECLRIDTNYALAYNMRGYTYYSLGNDEDAIADFTRTIRIDPDTVDAFDAYYWRGVVYYSLGNYEDAIADFTEFIGSGTDIADVYYNRGLAKQKAGLSFCSDYKKACDLGKEECCKWHIEYNCK